MIRQRAQARERGATPAFKKRDFNFVKCGMVKEWLVDTGCGYDLVSQRETGLIKRFVSKAKVPITFHTANGPTRTENIANIHVRELDENITPYVLENTPPVLTVAYRCMEMGYTFVWPTSQEPYFIRPDGMIIRLKVVNYIPYLFLMLIIANQGNPQEHESFVVHRKMYLQVYSRVRPIVIPTGRGQDPKYGRTTSQPWRHLPTASTLRTTTFLDSMPLMLPSLVATAWARISHLRMMA